MSALKNLILSQIKKKNISRYALACALDYKKNVSKGLRRLDSLLDTGNGTDEFINKLIKVLELNRQDYDKSVKNDEIDRENTERQAFKPFVQIIIPRGGMPIIPYAIILSHGIVPLDENLKSLSTEEEISTVLSITNTRIQSSEILSGITRDGFRYHRAYDECWVFDNDGQVIEKKFRHISPSTVELRIGNKKFPISTLFGTQVGGEANE